MIRYALVVVFALGLLGDLAHSAPDAALYPALTKYVESIMPETANLPPARKAELDKIAGFIREHRHKADPADLLFVCTHNSRRSHMAQLWASAAAAHYRVPGVRTFSGGTEATAFNPRAVAAMQRAGFRIEPGDGPNPHYKVSYASSQQPLESFSKIFGDKVNPQTNFAAVMTCAQADKSCPMVPGASFRVALHYEDPKVADGKPDEAATYDARARQIATEMFYLFGQLAK